MQRYTYSRYYNQGYAAACAVALSIGFFAGIALIPDGLLRDDQISVRTIATYFFHAGAVNNNQLASGWSAPDGEGTWSLGSSSVLQIDLDEDHRMDMEVEFVFYPFLAKKHKSQTVHVIVNNHAVDSWKLSAPTRRNLRTIHVKRSIWNSRNPKKIEFEYAKPRSPAELGLGDGDERRAILLSSLVVREQR